MVNTLLYSIGKSKSCSHCVQLLKSAGISLIDHPSPEVTHLLLDVPSVSDSSLEHTLRMLPPDVRVIGGNLHLTTTKVWDLLCDEEYLSQNAAVTAHCAIKVALPYLNTTLADTKTLIIGWGRIGKCLARLLKAMGCPVTVATRNPAILRALGYAVQDTAHMDPRGFQLLFNTVPEPILSEEQLLPCPNCVKIDLASRPGLGGADIISARGLPGKYAPESSGKLQYETILRYIKEDHP